MYRFSIALLTVFMLAFSACTDDAETVDDMDGDDIIVDDTQPVEPMDDGLFTTWDTNTDTYIDADEFGTSYRNNVSFTTWDADADGLLSEEEFDAGYGTSVMGGGATFAEYDTDGDGFVSEDEIYAGALQAYDTDGDGRLSEAEFAAFESMMGGTGTMDDGMGSM